VKLADLRKLSIRRQIRIRFPLRNGMECVVNEHGVAQVPALRSIPDFNLEEELATASTFMLEPVAPGSARQIAREELDGMIAAAPAPGSHPEHEDE
jgi:hypothetical protein